MRAVRQDENYCDHTSVGALIRNEEGHLLLFQRATDPFCIAGPAGHCDGDAYPDALMREVREEVGLSVVGYRQAHTFTFYGGCRRLTTEPAHHAWVFYEVQTQGVLQPSPREVLADTPRYYSGQEVLALMEYTFHFHMCALTPQDTYAQVPGLDLPWYRLFHERPDLAPWW